MLLLIAPVWFTVTFTILGRTFDYPDILRRFPDEVLSRLRAGGARLLMHCAGLVLGSAEFLGPNEEKSWSLAGKVVPILYVVWSLWLVGVGLILLLRR